MLSITCSHVVPQFSLAAIGQSNLKTHSTGSQSKRSDSTTFDTGCITQPEAGDYTGGSTGDSGFEDIKELRQHVPFENFPTNHKSETTDWYLKLRLYNTFIFTQILKLPRNLTTTSL